MSNYHYKGEVTEMPEGYSKWMKDNAERVINTKKKPYFINDNIEYAEKALGVKLTSKGMASAIAFSGENVIMKPTTIKDITEIQEVMDSYAQQHPKDFVRGYKGIRAVSKDEGYMGTDTKGDIWVNFAEDVNGFNAGENLISAFRKIKSGKPLMTDEEYSMEALWHEILHNKSRHTINLPEVNSPLGFTRVVAETTNQFVARRTYPKFLESIGGTFSQRNYNWVLNEGHGYNEMVKHLNQILDRANIDKGKFQIKAEKILMKSYEDIDNKIASILRKMYTGKGDIEGAFMRIELTEREFAGWLNAI